MATIKAPSDYTGLRAGVMFTKGVAETDDKHLIDWFKAHGYKVKEPTVAPPEITPDEFDKWAKLEAMSVDELKDMLRGKVSNLGNIKNKTRLIELAKEVI